MHDRFRWIIGITGLVGIILVPHLTNNRFLIDTLIFTFILVIMGVGWNVLGGYAGQISLGHAVMYGAGAYGTTLLYVQYEIPPVIGIWIACVLAAGIGIIIGAITFRLKHHYFAMGTLVIALIARALMKRWQWIGGATGLQFPPGTYDSILSLTFTTKMPYYYLMGSAALLVIGLVFLIDKSKLGIYLKAINMDQELAENFGINVFKYKMYAMGISSAITGLAGGMYSIYVMFVTPDTVLDVFQNVDPIIVTLLGGVGTVLGPVIGAFIFVPVETYTRSFISGTNTGLGWVLFGIVIILLSIYRPGGILDERVGGSE